MRHSLPDAILAEGRYLRFVRAKGWEYVDRSSPVEAAFIGAITDDGKLLVTEEFRIPVNSKVIGCPAGLIGDLGDINESIESGVERELEEETGYTAKKITLLTRGPTSPGMSTEVIHVVLAEGLTKVSRGGGVGDEDIQLHEVPLTEIDGWLEDRVREGKLIDPKVYTVLYFVGRRGSR